MEALYNRNEAARYLRISVAMLDNEVRAGKIQRVKFGTTARARVLFRRADLEEYIDAHVGFPD